MHELSLARNIFDAIEETFPKERLMNMIQIDLKVGLLSNVEPILMQNAFDAIIAQEPIYQGVKLNITTVPVLIHCNQCSEVSEIAHYKFYCELCGSPDVFIKQGNELLISSVHFMEE